MKREGRQHGLVRTYGFLENFSKSPSPARHLFDFPPTAGLFTKVPSKPNNHSKFTSKCSRSRCFSCRSHPVSKSSTKSKKSQKIRSHDGALEYWQEGLRGFGRGFGGDSASRVLDEMMGSERGGKDDECELYGSDHECGNDDVNKMSILEVFEDRRVDSAGEVDGIVFDFFDDRGDGGIESDDIEGEIDEVLCIVDDEEEDWDFVGFDFDQADGEEGWALVGGM
ncbi:hypothetical protein Drorol1_Dr00025039 [Drosera rotundifolia]